MKQLIEFLINSKSTGIIKVVDEFIDLELSSGTLWCTHNLGARSSEEYGLYYQWGDIKGYKETDNYNFNFKKYKFSKNKEITKYNEIDNIRRLEPEDDAATQFYKNKNIHIPTSNQCYELFDETEFKLVNKESKNYLTLTSKNNGNSIMFPYTGFFLDGNYIHNTIDIWTSDVTNKTVFDAYGFYTERFNLLKISHCPFDRWAGLNIRPVKDKN